MEKVNIFLKSINRSVPIIGTFVILSAFFLLTGAESGTAQLPGQTRVAASVNNISNNSTMSIGVNAIPQLAFSDKTNHMFVIWNEIKSTSLLSLNPRVQSLPAENHTSNLYYRVSGDYGKTFGKTISLDNFSQSEVIGPIVTSDENGTNAYAAWAANTTDNNYQIYFTRTSTDGSNFVHPVVLTSEHFTIASHTGNTSSVMSGIMEPQIIASSGNHVFLL